MHRVLEATRLGIGARLTIGFGTLVGLTLLVVALAILAGRDATRDIEESEAVRAPASLAAAQAQEALLRMQLHLRGYLVLSDREDRQAQEILGARSRSVDVVAGDLGQAAGLNPDGVGLVALAGASQRGAALLPRR